MGDSGNSTEPKGDSSTQGGGEVDPIKRLPSFKPPRDLTLTMADSVETKTKRKSSLGRPSKKSKAEKNLPTKAKSIKASSEGMGIPIRRSGRNAPSTAPKAQKDDEDDKKSAVSEKSSDELGNNEEKKVVEEQLPEEVPPQSAQEQKTDEDKETEDANVVDVKEELIQKQLAEKSMEVAAGIALNTEPQPEEQKEQGDAMQEQASTAGEEGHKEAEDKEKMMEEAFIIQTLD